MNDTFWSSLFCVLERYVKLHSFLNKLDESELDKCLLSPTEKRKVESIIDSTKDLEGRQINSQINDVTLSDVRNTFLERIQGFPSMQGRSKPDAQTEQYSLFKDVVVQIQSGKEGRISTEQRKLVSNL